MVVYVEPRSHTEPVNQSNITYESITPFPHAFNATGCTIFSPTIAGQLFLSSLFPSFLGSFHTPLSYTLSLSLFETVTIISKVCLSTNEGFGFVHLRYIHLGIYMEKKEMGVSVKSEDVVVGVGGGGSSSLLNGFQFSSVFDFCEVEKSSSLGFMELLGVQDYSSLLDETQLSTMSSMSLHQTSVKSSSDTYTGKECSEVLNQLPQTPNSCSISSASSEAVNDEQHNKTLVDQVQEDDDEEEKQKTSKQLKTKKTNQKRQREPRFAFMTKSEVDHLEDGYRWRKYGQKAVKNSPFPRSYYRCTTVSCNVKKRVERSYTDPTIVVTTYEGQHIHPSPAMSRSAFAGVQIPPPAGVVSGRFPTTNFGSVLQGNYLSQYQQEQHHQHQRLLVNTLSSLSHPYNYNASGFTQERKLCNPGTSSFLRDHGLLQDVVPSHMLKEE